MDEVIITAIDKVKYDLDTLVGGIDTKNIHDEVSFGAPAGKEAL
jgi:antitoxin component of MazEF toxin-antitoxin module